MSKKKINIFLVDDHQIVRDGIKSLLLDSSEISIAGEAMNGKELMEKIEHAIPDVILMDIMMPVMDGLEATAQIRKFEKETPSKNHTPVIAITANTLDNDRDKCIATGMDEYMAKPFDMNRLNEIFKELNIIA